MPEVSQTSRNLNYAGRENLASEMSNSSGFNEWRESYSHCWTDMCDTWIMHELKDF